MEDVMKEFAQAATERPAELRELKQKGKKVVPYIGHFIPEELLFAAGVEPYLICRGGEPEPPEAVLDDMLRFLNPLARSIAGFHMMGLDPVMPLADLIVASQSECHVQRIAELLEHKGLPVFKVGVPPNWDKAYAGEYYFRELEQLKAKLEELSGVSVSDDRLREYIGYTNDIHAALRKIDELRKNDSPPLGGYDFIHLNHHSFYVEPRLAAREARSGPRHARTGTGQVRERRPADPAGRSRRGGRGLSGGEEPGGFGRAHRHRDAGRRHPLVSMGYCDRGRPAQEPVAGEVPGQGPGQHLPARLEGPVRAHARR